MLGAHDKIILGITEVSFIIVNANITTCLLIPPGLLKVIMVVNKSTFSLEYMQLCVKH